MALHNVGKWANLHGRACVRQDMTMPSIGAHTQHCSKAGAGLSPACSRLKDGANAKQQQRWWEAVPCLQPKGVPAAAALSSALP